MPVTYRKWITRQMLKDEPRTVFVFGDNIVRQGLGGQAREMRGEANAFGVATLYGPGVYYDNKPHILFEVLRDLAKIVDLASRGAAIVAPTDGLGTGFARLVEHRPDLHDLIVAVFKAMPGEPCPWLWASEIMERDHLTPSGLERIKALGRLESAKI